MEGGKSGRTQKTELYPIVESLIPIFALITLGYELRRYEFPGSAFWPLAEKLTYHILFPALLLHTLATTDLTGLDTVPMAAAQMGALGLVVILLVLLKPVLRLDDPSFTSIFQGSIRPNTYVGLAVTFALFQDNGAAIALISLIPLVNLLSVIILSRYDSTQNRQRLNALVLVLKNPLIIACALGIIMNGHDRYIPWWMDRILDILGQASLPLSLLIAGAGLDVRSIFSQKAAASLAGSIKLLLLPLVTLSLYRSFNVGYPASTVAVLFMALPGAPFSYILSCQLDGNNKLMAGILTIQTALAFITMPIILSYMGLSR